MIQLPIHRQHLSYQVAVVIMAVEGQVDLGNPNQPGRLLHLHMNPIIHRLRPAQTPTVLPIVEAVVIVEVAVQVLIDDRPLDRS